MRQVASASWVSQAVKWVATRLHSALGWLQGPGRQRPADAARGDAGREADAAPATPRAGVPTIAAAPHDDAGREADFAGSGAGALPACRDAPAEHAGPAPDGIADPAIAPPANPCRDFAEPARATAADVEPELAVAAELPPDESSGPAEEPQSADRLPACGDDASRASPLPACGESTRRPMAAVFEDADAKHRLCALARSGEGLRSASTAPGASAPLPAGGEREKNEAEHIASVTCDCSTSAAEPASSLEPEPDPAAACGCTMPAIGMPAVFSAGESDALDRAAGEWPPAAKDDDVGPAGPASAEPAPQAEPACGCENSAAPAIWLPAVLPAAAGDPFDPAVGEWPPADDSAADDDVGPGQPAHPLNGHAAYEPVACHGETERAATPDARAPAPDAGAPAPAAARAKIWIAERESAEQLVALLEGWPIGCDSAAAEELKKLIDDEEFSRVADLIAASDRRFDDLRLPAAKYIYETIMARPLRPREPVRFREPVHDVGVLQMLYAALRDFAQNEGVPLIIPPAGVTMLAPTGEVVVHAPWWTCDLLGQELKAPDPDLRAANGRTLARWFPHLAADILEPARIATLTSAPKPGRKAAGRSGGPGGDVVPEDPPIDAVVSGEAPGAAIWLRGHGVAAWTMRMAMLNGTRILDVGELDPVRREVEIAAWHGGLRRKLLTALATYIADPGGYDAKGVKRRLARKAADPIADTPFALHDEHALFAAWRHARHHADIPFDRTIGMPSVDVLAAELVAQIAPPFCATLAMASPLDAAAVEPQHESDTALYDQAS
jgi:hypothetical protein